jgi:hypothetical protein
LAPVVVAVAAAAFVIWKPKSTTAEPGKENGAAAAPVLPISKVVLFSSGVGYFERKGEIEGSTRVDLTFQVRDINDLIKSMVLQDEKGVVSAVSYDSFDPVERTLKSFTVNLTGNPSFAQILGQLRGEKVEVVLQQTAANQPGTVTGSIIGLETQQQPGGKDAPVNVEVLNVWCAEGVRSLKLNEVQRLRFLNPVTESEFRRALDTLALSHDAQKKAVTLNFTGEGKRNVSVGYVVENPIWKTSYRLVLDKDGKPFLQGWAVVDNPTDDDWNGVGMALISGRPISFQMDLYQPLYVPRPLVEMELFQSLRPVAYGGAVGSDKKSILAKQQSINEFAPAAGFGMAAGDEADKNADRAALGAVARRSGAMAGRPLAEDLKKKMNLQDGIQSAASASQLGDFFQYVLNQPVSLPRQKSALLPIVNKEIDGTRLSIYNQAVHAKFPMLGYKLKNSSGLHLMQGPITVFEGSTYAGDARIQDVSPGDERLISYAVDVGTEVEAKSQFPPQRLVSVRVEHGMLIRTDKVREEKTYTATNRSGQARTLWVEHPYRPEFTLVSTEKPVERTQEVYRFEMKLPAEAKTSVAQTVVEERDVATQIGISNSDDDTIRFFMNNAIASPELKKALQAALDLKGKLAAVRQDLGHVVQQLKVITDDQARLRANLREMPEKAAAYKRYLEKFDKQETEIEKLQEQQKMLQADELRQRQELDRYLAGLNVK